MSYTDSERKLTNDDFRKLFMTPRHPGESGRSKSDHADGGSSMPPPATPSAVPSSIRKHYDKEKSDKRKSKKSLYAKIKKEEDDQMAELAKRYRDRAKERREGVNPEGAGTRETELLTSQGAYRAVAPDFRGNMDAAERRKQLIQESKFLGGDMEHTHLVKGLDYALLQKVKSEIDTFPEGEEGIEVEEDSTETTESEKSSAKSKAAPEAVKKEKSSSSAASAAALDLESSFKTKMGKNVYRVLFRNTVPERNELFVPGRMAFVMDLEDEYAESDIPTTLIRSKADVPLAEGQATLTTNDIVINKLAQILSYLRQGSKSSKKQKKAAAKEAAKSGRDEKPQKKLEDDSIYGDIGDYEPTVDKSKSKGSSRREEKDRKKSQYFEKPSDEDDREVVLEQADKMVDGSIRKRDREAWNEADGPAGGDQTFGSILKKDEKSMSRTQKLLSKINSQPEGYAECYPGFDEMHDAMDDSDEETDYSKMDPGKKKGTVGRWDFDSMEEYSEYMSNKEALPKAAFQFGVKMGDGRKTRKVAKTEKQEKQQLDRQWQQIQSIIEKRKAGGGGGGSADGEPVPKTPRV